MIQYNNTSGSKVLCLCRVAYFSETSTYAWGNGLQVAPGAAKKHRAGIVSIVPGINYNNHFSLKHVEFNEINDFN